MRHVVDERPIADLR